MKRSKEKKELLTVVAALESRERNFYDLNMVLEALLAGEISTKSQLSA